jgi:hypothetical protein
LKEELGGAFGAAQLLVHTGSREELLTFEVGLGRLRGSAGALEKLPRPQVVVLLLEPLDLALELPLRPPRAEHLADQLVAADAGAGDAQVEAGGDGPVDEEEDDQPDGVGHEGVI